MSIQQIFDQLLVEKEERAASILNRFIEMVQPQNPQIQQEAQRLGIDCSLFKTIQYSDFKAATPQVQRMKFERYAYKIISQLQVLMDRKKKLIQRKKATYDFSNAEFITQQELPHSHPSLKYLQPNVPHSFTGTLTKTQDSIAAKYDIPLPQQGIQTSISQDRINRFQVKKIIRRDVWRRQLQSEIQMEKKQIDYEVQTEYDTNRIGRNLQSKTIKQVELIQDHLSVVESKRSAYQRQKIDDIRTQIREKSELEQKIKQKELKFQQLQQERMDETQKKRFQVELKHSKALGQKNLLNQRNTTKQDELMSQIENRIKLHGLKRDNEWAEKLGHLRNSQEQKDIITQTAFETFQIDNHQKVNKLFMKMDEQKNQFSKTCTQDWDQYKSKVEKNNEVLDRAAKQHKDIKKGQQSRILQMDRYGEINQSQKQLTREQLISGTTKVHSEINTIRNNDFLLNKQRLDRLRDMKCIQLNEKNSKKLKNVRQANEELEQIKINAMKDNFTSNVKEQQMLSNIQYATHKLYDSSTYKTNLGIHSSQAKQNEVKTGQNKQNEKYEDDLNMFQKFSQKSQSDARIILKDVLYDGDIDRYLIYHSPESTGLKSTGLKSAGTKRTGQLQKSPCYSQN